MQNSWTNENAEKSVGETWLPMRRVRSVWGGAKVKFCQTKMETRSCKYGFILFVHLWHFYASKGVIYLKITLEKQLIVLCIIGCSHLLL